MEEFMVLHVHGAVVKIDLDVGLTLTTVATIFVKNAVVKALLSDTWLNIEAWSMQKHVPFLNTHQKLIEADLETRK